MHADVLAFYVFVSGCLFAAIAIAEQKIYEWRHRAESKAWTEPLRPGWTKCIEAWVLVVWLTGFMGMFTSMAFKGMHPISHVGMHSISDVGLYFLLALQVPPLAAVVSAVKKTKKWLRYGDMTLHLERKPIRLGSEIRGWMTFRNPDAIGETISVSVKCERNYLYPGAELSSWEAIWTKSDSIQIVRHKNGGHIEFAFRLPANLPVSEVKPKTADPSHHEWNLTVSNGQNGRGFWYSYDLWVTAEPFTDAAHSRAELIHASP